MRSPSESGDIVLLGLFTLAILSPAREESSAPGSWVWPMPRLGDGRVPVITDGYRYRSTGKLHAAVDVMYRRGVPMTGRAPFTDNGSKKFEVPQGTAVLAAAAGKIWATGVDAHGGWVVIDHGEAGGGRSTVYRHLEVIAVPEHAGGRQLLRSAWPHWPGSGVLPPLQVEAGDVIGTVGYDPTDRAKIRHLHFEVRKGRTPFDPQPEMIKQWKVIS